MKTLTERILSVNYLNLSPFSCQYSKDKISCFYASIFPKIPSVYLLNNTISKEYLKFIHEKYSDLKCVSQNGNQKLLISESQEFMLVAGDSAHRTEFIIYNIENTDLLNVLEKMNNEFTFKKTVKKPIGNIYTLQIVGTGQNARLQFCPTKIKNPKIDISLNYNDDFQEYDNHLREILTNENKGIAILHGVPGSGKTYYLRHLLNEVNKKMLFIPPSMVHHITEPSFMKILKKHKKAVLIIEDADNVLKKRTVNSTENHVSNLLNLSDGLLSDTMELQIVCTFNNDLSTIDEAFLRKGRLILEYKFEELTAHKAQKLCNKLGSNFNVLRPMTIAECYNTKRKMSSSMAETKSIGFVNL